MRRKLIFRHLFCVPLDKSNDGYGDKITMNVRTEFGHCFHGKLTLKGAVYAGYRLKER